MILRFQPQDCRIGEGIDDDKCKFSEQRSPQVRVARYVNPRIAVSHDDDADWASAAMVAFETLVFDRRVYRVTGGPVERREFVDSLGEVVGMAYFEREIEKIIWIRTS